MRSSASGFESATVECVGVAALPPLRAPATAMTAPGVLKAMAGRAAYAPESSPAAISPWAMPSSSPDQRQPTMARSAAATVFASRIVTVIGPTPPGTGVIAAAFAAPPRSQYRPRAASHAAARVGHPVRADIMTTAPSRTMPAVIVPGRPIAATIMSAGG